MEEIGRRIWEGIKAIESVSPSVSNSVLQGAVPSKRASISSAASAKPGGFRFHLPSLRSLSR